MIELIKELLNEGHDVTIVEVKAKKTITFTSQNIEMPEMKDFKVQSIKVNGKKFVGKKNDQGNPNNNPKSLLTAEMVEAEKKKPALQRINWKTINKIKEAKDDGLSSAETAKDLGLPLAVVNKYWIK